MTLVAEIASRGMAQVIQLQLEYAPAPPFDSGTPETAPAEIQARVRELSAPVAARRRAAVEAAIVHHAAASGIAPNGTRRSR